MNIKKIKKQIDDYCRVYQKRIRDIYIECSYKNLCLSDILEGFQLVKTSRIGWSEVKKYYKYKDEYVSALYYVNSWGGDFDLDVLLKSITVEKIVGTVPLFKSEVDEEYE